MVFNRVVSLLDVGLVFVGSLENSWLVVVIRCPVCGLKCIPLVHVVGFLLSGRTPCIMCLCTCFCRWAGVCHFIVRPFTQPRA